MLFIVPGAYLRTTDAAAAGEGDIPVGLDVAVPDAGLGTVLIQLIPIGVMLGLMLFTTAVAALIALRNDTRKEEIRKSGAGDCLAALLTEAQVRRPTLCKRRCCR